MGLVVRKGPDRGPGLVGRALHDLRGRSDPHSLLGGASVNLSEPLPIYRLGLADLGTNDCLARAEHVGWRYLIENQGKAAFADLREAPGEPVRFASLSQNDNADRLIEAAHLSEAVGGGGEYELRILEVPSLNTSAVWLCGTKPLFIPFIDRERVKGRKVQVEAGFLDRIVRRAERARMTRNDLPSRSLRGG